MQILDAGVPLSFSSLDEELHFSTTLPQFTLWQRIIKWFWREWHWLGRPVDQVLS